MAVVESSRSRNGEDLEEMDATALWFEAPNECRLCTERLSLADPDAVTVRALFSGISRGTESIVFSGKVPASERERMRAPHQAGQFPFPVKYGYALVGEVEEGPQSLVGLPVFCLHPHQDWFRLPASQVYPLPPEVPPARAVLAANMETALNIIWDAEALPGDRIAVFGAGVVGLLTAYVASRIVGTEVVICDLRPERAYAADALGLMFSSPEGVADNCDLLINASAAPEALEMALDRAGFEARIVEASWYGQVRANIPLGGAFHTRRLTVISSQVGSVPARQRARWNRSRRLEKALQLLADDCLDVLISGETPFSSIAAAYPDIIACRDTLCHRVHY